MVSLFINREAECMYLFCHAMVFVLLSTPRNFWGSQAACPRPTNRLPSVVDFPLAELRTAQLSLQKMRTTTIRNNGEEVVRNFASDVIAGIAIKRQRR